MGDAQGEDRHSTFWTVLGALLAVFGATFAVVTYVVPVESTLEKLALSLVVASASALIFRAIQVLFTAKRADPLLSMLTFVTVGLMVWYTVLLVVSRDAKIEALEQQARTTIREEPTPTAERWPSGPGTASPAETESSVEQDSATPQAPKTTIPSEAPLPNFASSAEEVYSTGTATLYLGRSGLSLYDWARGGHIVFKETALVGQEKTQLGLLTEGSDTSFAACRDHTAWIPAINWHQVQRGSFACLRTNEGRRGILRIDTIPNFGENSPSVVLTGHVWDRIVDR